MREDERLMNTRKFGTAGFKDRECLGWRRSWDVNWGQIVKKLRLMLRSLGFKQSEEEL